jgi:hypothetical protein
MSGDEGIGTLATVGRQMVTERGVAVGTLASAAVSSSVVAAKG